MGRLAIPADIRRAVLVEAGHRCAVPRCGSTELDIHHIVPWETCQKHEYSNLIALCPTCHRRAGNGDIDRKALLLYKAALTASGGAALQGGFDAPIVEIRRRIAETNTARPGYRFEFDFPDFPGPTQRVVSKNLEAWGYELLSELRHLQETHVSALSEADAEVEGSFAAPSRRKGVYDVIRNDEVAISVEYMLERFFTGAAHGGTLTRVQNFLIRPFQPITLAELIAEDSSIEALSSLIRGRLLSREQYSEEWVRRGTEPEEENFSRFVLEEHGIRFIFEEYQIDCFAAGRQVVWIQYDELTGVAKPSLLAKLKKEDV